MQKLDDIRTIKIQLYIIYTANGKVAVDMCNE